MIKVDDRSLTMEGSPEILLLETTRIIKTLKHELEKQGVPEEKVVRLLHDAFMFAVVDPEHMVKLMLTYDPGEVIRWDEILN